MLKKFLKLKFFKKSYERERSARYEAYQNRKNSLINSNIKEANLLTDQLNKIDYVNKTGTEPTAKCNVCGKYFKNEKGLNIHMATHK